MKNTSKTRLWALLSLSISLTGIHTDIHGREDENVFSRSWAWLKEQVPSIGQGLKRSRLKRPSKKLAYKAAQLNDLVATAMSQENKDIVIANIEQLRLLAQYGANGVPEAQYVLQALLLHGKQKAEKSHQAAQLYAEQFAPEQHKTYLCSKNGTNTLALLLIQAPPIVPLVPYAATKYTETALTEQITTLAGKFERQLHQIQKQLTQHEQNPELVKALQKLENNEALQEKQKQIEELDQLLEQKSQDPELQKVLPLVQQKDKELEAQLIHVMQNPGLTTAQKEAKTQEILAEYEKFVAQYPAVQSYLDLFKQRIQAGQDAQEHVTQLTAQHSDIIQFAQLTQAQQQAIDGYNKCVTQLQSVPEAVKQLADQRNITLWCEKLQDWFAACKKALKEDDHPENHILHYEQDLKQYKGEWKALCNKWSELHEPIALQHEQLELSTQVPEYQEAIENITQSQEEVKKRIALEVTYRYKLPLSVKQDCELLGIINPGQVNDIVHRSSPEQTKELINESFQQALAQDRSDLSQKQAARTRLLRLIELDQANHEAYQDMLFRYNNPALWQEMRKDNVPHFKQIIENTPDYIAAVDEMQEEKEQEIDNDYGYFYSLFPKSKQLIAQKLSDNAIEHIEKQQKKSLKYEEKLSNIACQIALLQREQQELETDEQAAKEKLKKEITEKLMLPVDVDHDCCVLGINDPALRKKIMRRKVTMSKTRGESRALSVYTGGHLIYSDTNHLYGANVEGQDASSVRLTNYLRMDTEQEEQYYELLGAYYNPAHKIETLKATVADLQQQKNKLEKQTEHAYKEQQQQTNALQKNNFVKKYDPEYTEYLHNTLQSRLTKQIKKLNNQIDKTEILKAQDCWEFKIKPGELFSELEQKKELQKRLKEKYRKFSLQYHPDKRTATLDKARTHLKNIVDSNASEQEIDKAQEEFATVQEEFDKANNKYEAKSGAYGRITKFLQLDPETDFEKITRIKQLLALKSKLQKQTKPSPFMMQELKKSKPRFFDYQKNAPAYQTYNNVSQHT